MLPVKKTKYFLRYYDINGFEHTIEGKTQSHLEAKLEYLIKRDQATLMNHVFYKTEEWV